MIPASFPALELDVEEDEDDDAVAVVWNVAKNCNPLVVEAP